MVVRLAKYVLGYVLVGSGGTSLGAMGASECTYSFNDGSSVCSANHENGLNKDSPIDRVRNHPPCGLLRGLT